MIRTSFLFTFLLMMNLVHMHSSQMPSSTLVNAQSVPLCVGKFVDVGETCGLITSSTRTCCIGGLTCSTKSNKCVKPTSVMFIGNSFTIRNSLPTMFRQLVKSSDSPESEVLIIQSSAVPSASLNYHTTIEQTWHTLYARVSWDAVVLQEQSQFLSYGDDWTRDRVYPYALELAKAIGSLNAKTVLFETWGYRWGDVGAKNDDTYFTMQDRISQGAKYLEKLLEPDVDILSGFDVENTDAVVVSPVGDAWRLAYTDLQASGTENLLYNIDGKHPSARGTYLAACTLYATILNKSPIGLNYWPSGMSKETARAFQRYAAIATGFAKPKPGK